MQTDRNYIPGLDGLRALSVLLVIISHCGMPKVPGGLGVTVFFFISGYLISTLLFTESLQSGRIAVGRFYMRRYLRLMPELIVYIAVAGVGSWLFFKAFRAIDIVAALFYFTNYLKIFAPAVGDAPFGLGHF